MPVVVQEVVGELELVEADDLLHPLGAFGGGIRMDVDPTRHVGVRLARHHPGGRVEGVPVALVVHRHEVHHDHVVRQRVQPEQANLERGEHATAHINKFRRHNEARLTMQTQQADLERGENATAHKYNSVVTLCAKVKTQQADLERGEHATAHKYYSVITMCVKVQPQQASLTGTWGTCDCT